MATWEACIIKGGGKGLTRPWYLEQKLQPVGNGVCQNKGDDKIKRKLFIPFQPQECENKDCKVNGSKDWDNLQGKGEIVCHNVDNSRR